MRKLRVNDKVQVITGDYAGKQGVVKKIFKKKERLYVVVEGVNMVKKHIKKGMLGKDAPGGIIEIEAPIDASNVMLVCPACGKLTRVAINKQDGKKIRVCKKCGKEIAHTAVSKKKKAGKSKEKAESKKDKKRD